MTTKRGMMMRGYIVSVIVVCVIGSLVAALTPEGEGGGLSRHVRFVTAICLIIVCISPVREAIDWLGELDLEAVLPEGEGVEEYESIFEGAYSAAEVENLKTGIKDILLDRFGIDSAECSVSVKLCESESGKSELSSVCITLYGSAIFTDTGAIEEYLGRLLGCRIITVIG